MSTRLLAVDTALGACSVAVLEGETVLAHHFEEMARGHAEALAPMVERAMAGIAFASLDRLAVTVGPGTFTGQRVGLAFMRGLRIALDKPLIGVTTLEAIAAASVASSALRIASAAAGTAGAARAGEAVHDQVSRVAVIHDAKRDEVYLLLWDNGRTVFEPAVMSFAAAIGKIQTFAPCILAGTGAPAASAVLGQDFPLSSIRQPDALWVGRLGLTRAAPDTPPAPLYLRAPDAKLPTPP
jgi:tRNA threonylcarbamoyl adenosine modification protein YeaZ